MLNFQYAGDCGLYGTAAVKPANRQEMCAPHKARCRPPMRFALIAVIVAFQRTLAANDPGQSELVHQFAGPDYLLACPGGIYAVAFSPCGMYLIAGCSAVQPGLDNDERRPGKQGYVSIWSTRNFEEVVPSVELPGRGSVFDVTVSSDGRHVAVAHEGVTFIDVESGRVGQRYDVDAGTRYAVAVSEDGRLLIDAGAENDVHVIALETGELVHSFRGGVPPEADNTISPLERIVTSVAISGDNAYIAAGDSLGTDVWELATQRHVCRFPGSQGAGWSTLFSLSRPGVLFGIGSTSAFGVSQNPNDLGAAPWVGVWDVNSKALMQRLQGPTARIHATAFTADGRRLVMATSFPIGFRVVDTTTGGVVATFLTTERRAATAVAISPSGNSIAVGSTDRCLRVWKLP